MNLGSCSPTYASPRLGREERSLHWALSKFAEMDNEEFDNQTFVQSVRDRSFLLLAVRFMYSFLFLTKLMIWFWI